MVVTPLRCVRLYLGEGVTTVVKITGAIEQILEAGCISQTELEVYYVSKRSP